jgi:hypothetical protein
MVGPIGYQISHAVYACAGKDGQEEMADAIGNLISQADGFRGPRTMVYWFLHDELAKMEKAGDQNAPTTTDQLDRSRFPVPNPLGAVSGGNLQASQGTIKRFRR